MFNKDSFKKKVRLLFSSLFIPVQGQRWPESSQQPKVEPHHGQDVLPLQGILTDTHSLRLGQVRHINSPNAHIFGMWGKTRVPKENLHRPGENVPTPYYLNIQYIQASINVFKYMCLLQRFVVFPI